MKARSCDVPPADGKAIDQIIDELLCVMVRRGGEVGVFGGRQDGVVAKDFLYLDQVNARFDQMSGKTVAQAVRSDLFFIPQA